MKGRVIVLDHLGERPAAALLVDGVLQDVAIEPPESAPPLPGAIFRAVADRPMKGQGGGIVKLDGFNGFLRGGGKPPVPGKPLLVQVTGVAEPGKAIPVTARVLFKSRYCIITPGAPGVNVAKSLTDEAVRHDLKTLAEEMLGGLGYGVIVRSAAAEADVDEVGEDLRDQIALADAVVQDGSHGAPALLLDAPDPHHLAWRDWGDPTPDQIITEAGGFADHGILEALDGLRGAGSPLASGARLFVEPTRALVAVDVNTGADTSPAAGLKANISAARALPRLLRLKGLGGQIVIDFAPMPKKDRKQLEQVLRAALRADSVETSLVGWTPMGHFELQRKRDRLPLSAQDLP
ncbi:ribonuclease E/G [Tropicimonas sp. S265A]|uniref:ribonuclease E/G n=1 Tax=Tropicimonas sp. S265A TaxID=3415134 RepID=UPI003C7993FC